MIDPLGKTPYKPFSIGKQLAMSIILAAIRERHPAGAMRTRAEAWARENVPLILEQANRSGDLEGTLRAWVTRLDVVLSKKEAARRLAGSATGLTKNKHSIQKALAAGDFQKAIETKAMFLLRYTELRDLKRPAMQQCLALLKQEVDLKLLARLGRAAEKRPRSLDNVLIAHWKITLIRYWVRGPDGQVGLCRVTDEALTEFFRSAHCLPNLHHATVQRTRHRLGLKRGPKPWLNTVERIKGGWAIFRKAGGSTGARGRG